MDESHPQAQPEHTPPPSVTIAVVARLLDGWEPHPDPAKPIWWMPGSPLREPMTPSEAIIVTNVKGGLRRRNFPHQAAR